MTKLAPRKSISIKSAGRVVGIKKSDANEIKVKSSNRTVGVKGGPSRTV